MFSFAIPVFVLGLSGVVAQIVMLKELIVLFSGNELSLGLIIGIWIVGEAMGALSLTLFRSGQLKTDFFILSTLLFCLVFPSSIYVLRMGRTLLGVPQGILLDFYQMGIITVISIFPVCFLHGFLFNLACSVSPQFLSGKKSYSGYVYFYEMAGTTVGGVMVTYLLIPRFDPYEIANLIGIFSGLSLITMSNSEKDRGRLLLISGVLSALFLFFFLFGLGKNISQLTLKKVWTGREVVLSENSIHQNITVIRSENEYTIYTDGLPYLTIPNPDTFYIEELAHLPLLSHPMPKNILLLSIPPDLISEIAKYPSVEGIDYVEIDPKLMQIIESLAEKKFLGNVKTYYEDGRYFIRRANQKYDIIISGVKSPSTLQTNRFFTEEFFMDIKKTLNKGAIFFFHLPGSAYYTYELKMLNLSVFSAAKKVFRSVFVIPGDLNFFILTDSDLELSSELMAKRLSHYKINPNLINKVHLNYKLDQKRRDWFLEQMDEKEKPLNTDFTPFAFFFNISYESLKISSSMGKISRLFHSIKFKTLLLCTFLIFASLFLIGFKMGVSLFLPLCVFTTGFNMTVVEIVLIFVFQSVYGYVFYQVGLLLTAFMAGCAIGSILASKTVEKFKPIKAFTFSEIGLLIFAIIIIYAVFAIKEAYLPNALMHALFLGLLFLSGFFVGSEFSLGVSAYSDRKETDEKKRVGIIFTSDLLGGFLGAVGGTFIIFPMLGVRDSLLFLLIVKLLSFLLLLLFLKK